jgi:hypothetical protein
VSEPRARSGSSRIDSPAGRRLLFFSLYLSEGAPIGYLWLALPTRLRAAGVPVEQITALTSLLVLPWTFKFLVAPLVDGLRSPRWGRRHFVIASQHLMLSRSSSRSGPPPRRRATVRHPTHADRTSVVSRILRRRRPTEAARIALQPSCVCVTRRA